GLPPHDLVEFLVELFLVEQLPAGGAIDARAQLRDAVLIGVLHLGLARDQAGEDIVAERKIGGGRRRPHAEQGDGANADPEHDRPEANLLAGMADGVESLPVRRLMRRRAARGCTAVILRMVMRLVLGMLTGTMRHRHSRAGRTKFLRLKW